MSLFAVSVSDSEKACDFADFRAYRGGIHAEALKPEGKFGNTGIGDDLRDVEDPLGIGDGAAAELLHYQHT